MEATARPETEQKKKKVITVAPGKRQPRNDRRPGGDRKKPYAPQMKFIAHGIVRAKIVRDREQKLPYLRTETGERLAIDGIDPKLSIYLFGDLDMLNEIANWVVYPQMRGTYFLQGRGPDLEKMKLEVNQFRIHGTLHDSRKALFIGRNDPFMKRFNLFQIINVEGLNEGEPRQPYRIIAHREEGNRLVYLRDDHVIDYDAQAVQ